MTSLAKARLLALLLPAALLAGAWIGQLGFGLVPCEMCHWQRWPHYAALGFALAAFVAPAPARRPLVLLAGLCIVASGAIGIYHAGVEYRWWAGPARCTSQIGAGGSAADVLAQIMKAPTVMCDKPQWTLFGISLAGFNALLSIPGGLTVLALAGARRG